MSGWIKLQRDIMDHWIAQDNEYLAVWIRMLSEANFEPQTKMFNGQVLTVGRGQLLFGLESYSEKTKVSVMRLRRLIDLLEKHEMINRVKFSKFSLISIVNYDKHQAENRQTTSRQQADNNTIIIKEYKEPNNIIVDSGESPQLAMPKRKKSRHASQFEPSKEMDYIEQSFNVFWDQVEKKGLGKAQSLAAFRKVMDNAASDEEIDFRLNVICAYYEKYLSEKPELLLPENKQFIQQASTFINAAGWRVDREWYSNFKKQWDEQE